MLFAPFVSNPKLLVISGKVVEQSVFLIEGHQVPLIKHGVSYVVRTEDILLLLAEGNGAELVVDVADYSEQFSVDYRVGTVTSHMAEQSGLEAAFGGVVEIRPIHVLDFESQRVDCDDVLVGSDKDLVLVEDSSVGVADFYHVVDVPFESTLVGKAPQIAGVADLAGVAPGQEFIGDQVEFGSGAVVPCVRYQKALSQRGSDVESAADGLAQTGDLVGGLEGNGVRLVRGGVADPQLEVLFRTELHPSGHGLRSDVHFPEILEIIFRPAFLGHSGRK